ncbi:reverse transcriptase domain-containing protein [Tanacetum coccineum]|uniref:Reverse transcriptase domain-containing protein n=1 Tax=Tanacetum coccineum TaxID=301880 RepID=A0ABQ4YWB6_9ASTR
MKLHQHASLWWDHVKKQRYLTGKSKVESWEKMKKLTKEKFLPMNYRQEAFLDYHNFPQDTFTVEELINEFDRLHMRFDANEEEKEVISRFLGVLHLEIADVVTLVKHLVVISQGLGHYSRECPNQRTVSLVEEESEVIYYTDGNDVDESPKYKLLHLDQGESLVIQRVLSVATSKSIDDNSMRRNNIFRTKCTSKGKVSKRRPGQFHRKTKNDGFLNTYSFQKDGMRIILVPLDSRKSPEVDSIVIFNQEIPYGSPMMPDIQHCIDFVPGSSIVNNPAYRMNPNEYEELQ